MIFLISFSSGLLLLSVLYSCLSLLCFSFFLSSSRLDVALRRVLSTLRFFSLLSSSLSPSIFSFPPLSLVPSISLSSLSSAKRPISWEHGITGVLNELGSGAGELRGPRASCARDGAPPRGGGAPGARTLGLAYTRRGSDPPPTRRRGSLLLTDGGTRTSTRAVGRQQRKQRADCHISSDPPSSRERPAAVSKLFDDHASQRFCGAGA